MRVELCSRCPYTARDLKGHYDSEAMAYACARCDDEQDKVTLNYPLDPYRRRKGSIVPKLFNIPQRSSAPCVTASSVSSGTTPGDRLSVRGSGLNASRFVEKVTAHGCGSFKPAEAHSKDLLAALFSFPGLGKEETAN